MNWDDMRVFLTVARTGSLTSAGPILKMDPATVARRISRLEERLGTSLFLKSPQGYILTDVGIKMHEHAAQAESALNTAFDQSRTDASALSGQIRIGAPDGCAKGRAWK